jgi:thiol-disulfide isomerase/thioredoxin
MFSRRNAILATVALANVFCALPAHAFEFNPYDKVTVDKLIASGKPVVIHVYAPWCLQCHMQESILDGLKDDKTYDGVAFYRVSYDSQQDIVKALNVPRSTLIAYKGGKETGRMSWGMTTDSVVTVLKTAL